ncbi:hypothetical protein KDD17_12920 [Sulfitobacter albidus]|uniref:Uncharacterized protein n=1 Tax=Sulfitobacter albidus TaxID=2829501 RepID=A0A975JC95_9RHOB|nr:hypothetical protein [Sulfitobacter albidus]QUJ75834.1 hypothetical protein KDD17_12920 [Sulfitobacter albidus]
MGSLRRGVILALLPGPALAQSCADMRPGWTAGAEATAWTELIALSGTPASLVLLLASALVLRLRHQWGALIVTVLWSFWASFIAMAGPTQAAAEGCIGSPTLFIALVAAICTGMIIYTTGGKPRPSD